MHVDKNPTPSVKTQESSLTSPVEAKEEKRLKRQSGINAAIYFSENPEISKLFNECLTQMQADEQHAQVVYPEGAGHWHIDKQENPRFFFQRLDGGYYFLRLVDDEYYVKLTKENSEFMETIIEDERQNKRYIDEREKIKDLNLMLKKKFHERFEHLLEQRQQQQP